MRTTSPTRFLETLVLVATLATLLATGCIMVVHAPYEPGEARYHFEVALAQDKGSPQALTGNASVTDLSSKRTISTTGFLAPWGKTTQVFGEDKDNGARLEVVVTVDDGGHSATYEASLKKGSRLIATDHGTVQLKG